MITHDLAALRADASFIHGWGKVTAGVETAALVSAAVVAGWVRHHRWSFLLTLISVAGLAD